MEVFAQAPASDAVQIATLIAGVMGTMLALIGTMFTGFMAYQTLRLNKQAEAAAIKVEEVKQVASVAAGAVKEVKATLETATAAANTAATATTDKLNEIAIVGQKTEKLCNNAMLSQKRMLSVKCRAVAEKTKDPADLVEAEAAEQAYNEHLKRQEEMDAAEKAAATTVGVVTAAAALHDAYHKTL